jgi:2-polyprenyl-3-methyl-5-hydroxy-6-metoxy-1,4-benzoquinol methylase
MVEGDAAFYELLHERAGYPRERWEFRRARENFVGSGGRVLDVGGGRGDFLASLPDAIEKHAVEASPTLRSELARRGIVAHADLGAAAAAGPYHVVTMFHVLQYFADPVAALASCRAMLLPNDEDGGGRLLISLPNALAGGAIDVLPSPPHPLTRWTRTAIERAIAAAGMHVDGFAWIPQRTSSLLWAANARTRERAVAEPRSIAGRIDAMRRGRLRTALLLACASVSLPGILRTASSRLRHSQLFIVARP